MALNLFKKEDNTLDNLLNGKESVLDSITVLQNEINVGYNTKVIAVTSIENDALAAGFAKAMSDGYVRNSSSALIIDANMYNPKLSELLKLENGKEDDLLVEDGSSVGGYQQVSLSKKNAVICVNKQVYPGEAYKNKAIHKLIKDNEGLYEHFIVLVPSIKDHKEIYLLKDIIDCIVLVTRRNYTKKKDIFEAAQFCRDNKLPLAKTVVTK